MSKVLQVTRRCMWWAATGAFTVLLTFSVIMWVRSYFIYDYMARWNNCQVGGKWFVFHQHLNSGAGGVNLSFLKTTPQYPQHEANIRTNSGINAYWRTHDKVKYPTMRPLTGFWGKLGFRIGGPTQSSNASGWISGSSIHAPWWAPVLVLLTCLLLLFIGPFRRFRRKRRELCVRCGYNLRGLSQAIRQHCPECGTPFTRRVHNSGASSPTTHCWASSATPTRDMTSRASAPMSMI